MTSHRLRQHTVPVTAAEEGKKLYNAHKKKHYLNKATNSKERVKEPDSPLCDGSLLSATFLSAEATASEGMRGLSTYLGFRIGPAGRNHRHGGE